MYVFNVLGKYFFLLFADLSIKLYSYNIIFSFFSSSLEPYTVAFSQSSLIHLIGPSDCTMHGFVHGGNKFNKSFMIITTLY